MMETNHTKPTRDGRRRASGAWLAAGALLLMAALILHPAPETETDAFMAQIAGEGDTWVAVHWLAATALSFLVIASLLALTASQSPLAASAWAILAVGALWTVMDALAEATVIAEAAAGGDQATFTAWHAFAKGTAMGFAVLGLAVAGLGWNEARAGTVLPRWAALSVLPVGVAVFTGWILGPVLGIPFGAPLWLVASLVLTAWLTLYGAGSARSPQAVGTRRPTHA